VDRHDVSRAGFPGAARFSEIRVRLTDGSTFVLAGADGLGQCHREVAEVRRTLGVFGDG
jgi:hypothetical protein